MIPIAVTTIMALSCSFVWTGTYIAMNFENELEEDQKLLNLAGVKQVCKIMNDLTVSKKVPAKTRIGDTLTKKEKLYPFTFMDFRYKIDDLMEDEAQRVYVIAG